METRTTDAQARVTLPKGFANATVIVDQVSETEVRSRKAVVIPEDEVPFREEMEMAAPLSDRDWDRFLELLDHPPRANAALKRAATAHRKRNG